MDCINQLKIINPAKIFSLQHCDRYINYVRCGRCFACQEQLSKEWYFRTVYEFKTCLEHNGYVYIDTLTYKNPPRVSRFLPGIDKSLDFMCFDYKDIADFLKRVRIKLQRKGFDVKNNLRYFVSTEYGTDPNRTHRPHAHILFFVYGDLDNFLLSRIVSDSWKFGRTDGLPYKNHHYVNYNTIRQGLASSVRVAKYVSKYVNKNSLFQKEIDKRIIRLLDFIHRQSEDDKHFEEWIKTESAKKQKRDIIRHLNQFHRQSLGYGASLLRDLDINQVIKDNILVIPDGTKVVNRISLPLYYKRKLFYELVEIDGMKSWQLTDLGLKYKDCRDKDLQKRLKETYKAAVELFNIEIEDIDSLVDYVLNKRGRLKGSIPGDSLISVRAGAYPLVFNYVTSSDVQNYNTRFVSDYYLGNKTAGYKSLILAETITPNEFIKDFVYFDDVKELELSKINQFSAELNLSMQRLSENKDHLFSIYKSLGAF